MEALPAPLSPFIELVAQVIPPGICFQLPHMLTPERPVMKPTPKTVIQRVGLNSGK